MIFRALVVSAFMIHANAAPVEITPPELRGAQQPQVAIGGRGEVNVVFGHHGEENREARKRRP